MIYSLTSHAKHRLWERAIDDDAMAAALAGRVVETDEGTFLYDNASRTVLIVQAGHIVTAYRITRRQVKAKLSR